MLDVFFPSLIEALYGKRRIECDGSMAPRIRPSHLGGICSVCRHHLSARVQGMFRVLLS